MVSKNHFLDERLTIERLLPTLPFSRKKTLEKETRELAALPLAALRDSKI